MREILFRGKERGSGLWLKGDLIREIDLSGIIRYKIFQNLGLGSWELLEIDAATVGQYTGLQDKNGVKVFEGDIIDLFDKTFYVGFKEGEYILKIPGSDDFLSILLLQTEKFYVEGNIYDNPELIKKR